MTSTIRISPMPSATGFVENFGKMQAVPVPAQAVRILMVVLMFVLISLLLILLLLPAVFSLQPMADLMVQPVGGQFRLSGRLPIHFNTSRLRHSSREWRFGMTIQT